jgi:hypothetical protein
MIERVARALHKLDTGDGCPTFEDCNLQEYFLEQARTAIAAMREPTEAMVRATGLPPEGITVYWKAMIVAALAETATQGK